MLRIDENHVWWHGRLYSNKQVEVLKRNSFRNMDKTRHKELSSKGGRNSGESKRLKKLTKIYCNVIAENTLKEINRNDSAKTVI